MTDEEFRQVLGMLADTEPDLVVVENIEGYLDNRERLSDDTLKYLANRKDLLSEYVEKFLRNSIDNE